MRTIYVMFIMFIMSFSSFANDNMEAVKLFSVVKAFNANVYASIDVTLSEEDQGDLGVDVSTFTINLVNNKPPVNTRFWVDRGQVFIYSKDLGKTGISMYACKGAKALNVLGLYGLKDRSIKSLSFIECFKLYQEIGEEELIELWIDIQSCSMVILNEIQCLPKEQICF